MIDEVPDDEWIESLHHSLFRSAMHAIMVNIPLDEQDPGLIAKCALRQADCAVQVILDQQAGRVM